MVKGFLSGLRPGLSLAVLACLVSQPIGAAEDLIVDISQQEMRTLEYASLVAVEADFIRALSERCPELLLPELPDAETVDAAFVSAVGVALEEYLDALAPLSDMRLDNEIGATALGTGLECRQLLLDPWLWDVEFSLKDNVKQLATASPLQRPLREIFSEKNTRRILVAQEKEAREKMQRVAQAIVDESPSIAVVRLMTVAQVPEAERDEGWREAPPDSGVVEVYHGWKAEIPHYVPVGPLDVVPDDELYLVIARSGEAGYSFTPIHPDLIPMVMELLGPAEWRRVEPRETPKKDFDDENRQRYPVFDSGIVG